MRALPNEIPSFFVSVAKLLLRYWMERNMKYLPMLNLIETLTKYEPYDEAVRGLAMQIHQRQTGKQGVKAYFKKYQKLLETELGEKPGDAVCSLYEELTGKA